MGGSDQFDAPSDHVRAIVLGMGGHLGNSTMLGVAVWVVMRCLVLPLNDGTADQFVGATVSPQRLWYLAHAVFGTTLGLIYVRHHAAIESVPAAL